METILMDKLKNLVISGQLGKVFDLLEKRDLSDTLRRKVEILKFSYNEHKSSKQKLILSREDELIESGKIANSLLEILDEINSLENALEIKLEDIKVNKNNIGLKAYLIIGLISILFLFLLVFVYINYNKNEFKHCVVAKSFAIYSNAEKYKNLLIREGYKDAGIVLKRGGEIYVTCYMEFSNEKDAIYEWEKLKIKEREDELWIYKY